MKIRKTGDEIAKPDVQMTPMIDVVFQLLIFFMFTFKIISVEGEFSVNMPKSQGSSAGPSDPTTVLPEIKVRLQGDESGELTQILLNEEVALPSVEALAAQLAALTGNDKATAAETELQISAPASLHYNWVVSTINAAARAEIQKIKFNPPDP